MSENSDKKLSGTDSFDFSKGNVFAYDCSENVTTMQGIRKGELLLLGRVLLDERR